VIAGLVLRYVVGLPALAEQYTHAKRGRVAAGWSAVARHPD